MLRRVLFPGNGNRMMPAYNRLPALENETVMSAVIEPSRALLGTMALRLHVMPPSLET